MKSNRLPAPTPSLLQSAQRLPLPYSTCCARVAKSTTQQCAESDWRTPRAIAASVQQVEQGLFGRRRLDGRTQSGDSPPRSTQPTLAVHFCMEHHAMAVMGEMQYGGTLRFYMMEYTNANRKSRKKFQRRKRHLSQPSLFSECGDVFCDMLHAR